MKEKSKKNSMTITIFGEKTSQENHKESKEKTLKEFDSVDHFITIVAFSNAISKKLKLLSKGKNKNKNKNNNSAVKSFVIVSKIYLDFLDRRFANKSIYIMTVFEFVDIYNNLTSIMTGILEYNNKMKNNKKDEEEKQEKKRKEKQKEKQENKMDKKIKKREKMLKKDIKTAKKMIEKKENKLCLVVYLDGRLFAKVIKHDNHSAPSYEVILKPGNMNFILFLYYKEFQTFLCREIKLKSIKRVNYYIEDIITGKAFETLLYTIDSKTTETAIVEYNKHAISYIDKSVITGGDL
jgi:hypothetical protein